MRRSVVLFGDPQRCIYLRESVMHRSRNILRRSALSAAAAIAFGGLALMSIDPTQAAPAPSMTATATHATEFRSGDMLDGMVPFTQSIHIEVALKLRNTDALNSFIESSARAGTA